VVTPQEVAAIYNAGLAGKDLSTVSIGSGELGELLCAASGGALTITWTDTGVVLQQSSDLKTWTDVAGAASPYSPTVAGTPAMFYRLKK
jgi:hypothetical protein